MNHRENHTQDCREPEGERYHEVSEEDDKHGGINLTEEQVPLLGTN